MAGRRVSYERNRRFHDRYGISRISGGVLGRRLSLQVLLAQFGGMLVDVVERDGQLGLQIGKPGTLVSQLLFEIGNVFLGIIDIVSNRSSGTRLLLVEIARMSCTAEVGDVAHVLRRTGKNIGQVGNVGHWDLLRNEGQARLRPHQPAGKQTRLKDGGIHWVSP
jgi:hypothetical protein